MTQLVPSLETTVPATEPDGVAGGGAGVGGGELVVLVADVVVACVVVAGGGGNGARVVRATSGTVVTCTACVELVAAALVLDEEPVDNA